MKKGQGNYAELISYSKEKRNNFIPLNDMRKQTKVSMEKTVLEAYERYVMAQFKFTTEEDIEKERASAIESLIPGTVYYFHLYFLDLVKKKKTIDDFTDEEVALYNKFQEKHGKTSEFTEIETWVLVINRIEGLPKVDAETNEEGIKENLDVIEYLYYYYVKEEAEYERPEILDDNDAEDEDAEGSSLVK